MWKWSVQPVFKVMGIARIRHVRRTLATGFLNKIWEILSH